MSGHSDYPPESEQYQEAQVGPAEQNGQSVAEAVEGCKHSTPSHLGPLLTCTLRPSGMPAGVHGNALHGRAPPDEQLEWRHHPQVRWALLNNASARATAACILACGAVNAPGLLLHHCIDCTHACHRCCLICGSARCPTVTHSSATGCPPLRHRQLAWLQAQLAAAEAAGERVIVAAHHQVGQGAVRATHSAWNRDAIQALLLASPAFRLFLAGHDHMGGYACIEGRHFITLEALLEAPEGGNAYGVVEVRPSEIRIHGNGGVTSRCLAV